MTCRPSPVSIRSAVKLGSNGFEWIHSIFASEGPFDLRPLGLSGPSGSSAHSHTEEGAVSLHKREITVVIESFLTLTARPQVQDSPSGSLQGYCDWPRLSRLLLAWLLESVSLKAPIFLPRIFCKEWWMVRWIRCSSARNLQRRLVRPRDHDEVGIKV